ncbi:hypothetical protein J4Q44_G00141970 [Coregonus suidteri]|uniref:TERF1-interacting nuclear factor 2 N-terminal domain-containing protein n=1 Tax=Coregonus suidteri TaxID=861788 RepID=A0AAN8LLM3_9TELE
MDNIIDPASEQGLPLFSLRLLVPPLRLMSAFMWQVTQQRNVMQYGKLEEFVTLVMEMVPELLSSRQRTQLILGLRARLVLELCRSEGTADFLTVQAHLDIIHTLTEKSLHKESHGDELEASDSNFVELVQTLLEDPSEREHFFQEVFPVHYGPRYDTALQTLVWEFLSRLEELLPVPDLAQTTAWLGAAPSVLEECRQTVIDPEQLKTVMQHHQRHGNLNNSHVCKYTADTILSTLSLPPIVRVVINYEPDNSDNVKPCSDEDECIDNGVEVWEYEDNNEILDDDTDRCLEDLGLSTSEQQEGLSPAETSALVTPGPCDELNLDHSLNVVVNADEPSQVLTCTLSPFSHSEMANLCKDIKINQVEKDSKQVDKKKEVVRKFDKKRVIKQVDKKKEGSPAPQNRTHTCLPLFSLRLLVPPLRLMSAFMWQVVQQRNVMQYGKLEEFVTLVTEMVPELLSSRQRTQLILGLRARLVLELCRSEGTADFLTIQAHLDIIHTLTEKSLHKESHGDELEASDSNFVVLVQTLLEDPSEREHFFKEVFPVHYGPRYDTALQTLVWEFLSRLEELLPVPDLAQTTAWLGAAPSVLEECRQTVFDPEQLKTVMQHHQRHGNLNNSHVSKYTADTILSTLSLPPKIRVVINNEPDNSDNVKTCSDEDECIDNGVEVWEYEDNNEILDDDTDRCLEDLGLSTSEQQEGLSPTETSALVTPGPCDELNLDNSLNVVVNADEPSQVLTCTLPPFSHSEMANLCKDIKINQVEKDSKQASVLTPAPNAQNLSLPQTP